MLLSLGELTMDNAASPAGKKQTATSGCKKTATPTQDDEAIPINIVINPANKNFKPESGWKNVALPLHPGAEKFYREAGFMK